jgi:GTPase SAR1 family protein
MAKQLNATNFLETSAKEGDNVERAFRTLVHSILQGIKERKEGTEDVTR